MIEAPWRCSRYELYALTCKMDELQIFDKKLYELLLKYGTAFNDKAWFYVNRNGRVFALPLWMKQKRIDAEKHMAKIDLSQCRLFEEKEKTL